MLGRDVCFGVFETENPGFGQVKRNGEIAAREALLLADLSQSVALWRVSHRATVICLRQFVKDILSPTFWERDFCPRFSLVRGQSQSVVEGLFEVAREMGADFTKGAAAVGMQQNSLSRARERAKGGTTTDKHARALARGIDPPISVYDLWRKAIAWAEEHDDFPPAEATPGGDEAQDESA